MRRLLAIALFAALPVAAQIHGVPASVTSLTPGRPPHGVPASVTSLGPNGYVDPMFRRQPVDPMFRQSVDPMFRNPAYARPGFGRHSGDGRQHRHHRRFYPVYYYPYSYGYPVTYAEPAEPEYEPADEEPPALTIYERRPRIAYSTGSEDDQRYGEHYTDYREADRRREQEERQAEARRRDEEARQAEARAAAPAKPEDQEPVTVLVFKDGHRQDLRGYAITGNILYDLSDGRARKIQLADLDLPATLKLNEELGNDFRLPSRPPKN